MVTTEHRFERTPDGAVWTGTVYDYPYWQHYLSVFAEVQVLARVREVEAVPSSHHRADGPGVSFAAIPYYVGPCQYLLQYYQIRNAVRRAYTGDGAVILVNGMLADLLEPLVNQARQPFGLEVIADPYDVFSPGSIKHPLRPLFRWWGVRNLKRQCAHASAAAYVTHRALQKRYPCPNFTVSGLYLGELSHDAFVASARKFPPWQRHFTLLLVGSFWHLFKGPDILIDSVAKNIRTGLDVTLKLVGDGKHRPELEMRAKSKGLADRAVFLGQLPFEALRYQYDHADLFVLPSRQEGLPRVMIEAMARGCPCLGSAVGGIPELLHPEDLVPPGDAEALAQKIERVLNNPSRLECMSARNLEKSQEYRPEKLKEKRNLFLQHLKSKTEEWHYF